MGLGASTSPPLYTTIAVTTFSSPSQINSHRVCQTLDHFSDPLFSFEDPSSPPTENPTFVDYNVLDEDIPDPPLTQLQPYP